MDYLAGNVQLVIAIFDIKRVLLRGGIMFRNFELRKRPLLAVLGVLLASTLATATAATIDMSQLTSNGAKPVVISSTAANQNSAAPIINIETNTQPTTKVVNTPVSTPISITPEKASINTSNANYDGHLENFPSRKVTIVVPAKLRNENTAQFGHYMTDRLSNTLKYPYYDTAIVSTNTPTAQIRAVDLAQIAAAQNSEIVIMPVPLQDVYVQVNGVNGVNGINSPYAYNDEDCEIYITAKVNALLYYYDVNDKVVHTVRTGFNQTDDSLTMPTHKAVWNKVMTVLLDKLPYKRIPTDRDRYQAPGINSETPVVLDFQVEQPRNTAYSLKGVSVL